MKKIILSIMFLLAFAPTVFADACPSVVEFTEQTLKIQQKGLQMYKDSQAPNSKEKSDPMELIKENNEYIKSVTSGCVNYFKNTVEPDCTRFHSLSTAYILMNITDKKGLEEINLNMDEIKAKCPNEYTSLEQVQKQFQQNQIQY